MNNIIRRIKKSRLFILGAGFSAEAGIPMMDQLLDNTIKIFRLECPGLFKRIDNYTKVIMRAEDDIDYTKVDFADLCTFLEYIELREFGGGERWSDNASREKLALRFYLAKTIVNSMPAPDDIPDLYIQFANELRQSDIVITFNWDPLLEIALTKVKKSFAYNNFGKAEIRIYKLHGSINWRVGLHCISKNVWTPLGLTKGMMKDELYYCKEALYKNEWNGAKPLMGELEPFLILPGAGKAYDVRAIAPIWYKPEDAFAVTHHVYIIGLSLSDDDFFVKSFFLDTLPDIDCFSGVPGREITIINPDRKIVENYSFIKSRPRVNFVLEKFNADHVRQIRRT
jgi:hypothetical protein